MRRVSVPGKVMLAGEYAVLLPHEPCLVAGVERRLFVEATPAERWSATSGAVRWVEGEPVPPELSFVVTAITEARKRFPISPQHLHTSDELHEGELKLGLGGSAAVTVGATFAVVPRAVSRDVLWAMADDVHRAQQGGKGSGADVAASVHGGVIRYTSRPREAAPLVVHPDVRLLLVWTGASAKTAPRLMIWSELVAQQPAAIRTFAKLSREAVEALERGLTTGDRELIRGGIGQARSALRGLEAISGIDIETEPLRLAAEVAWKAGAAGKLSGAGGGDCAIVLALGDEEAARVTDTLSRAGLTVIPVPFARTGATVSET
jgi:phosphomevalonate kinase